MTRSHNQELVEFDPEIDRTYHRNSRRRCQGEEHQEVELKRANLPQENTMAHDGNGHGNGNGRQRTMGDYARPSLSGTESCIARPRVDANNFEIKANIIHMVQQMVQFDGLPDEDPNAHIANFLELCDTFKINGVSEDAIRLRLFPFSLRDRAKSWLKSLPPGSITTWNELVEKFLSKYFPPARTARLRNDIFSFQQMEGESLYDSRERWKELLRRCPHHGLDL